MIVFSDCSRDCCDSAMLHCDRKAFRHERFDHPRLLRKMPSKHEMPEVIADHTMLKFSACFHAPALEINALDRNGTPCQTPEAMSLRAFAFAGSVHMNITIP